jgi:hypothetical protein
MTESEKRERLAKINAKYPDRQWRSPCEDKEKGFSPRLDKNNQKSQLLIIGSITSLRGIEKGYYYTSSSNDLWAMVDTMLGKKESGLFKRLQIRINQGKATKEDFEKALEDKGIEVCDIFKGCWFKNSTSSSDGDIIDPIIGYPDFTQYFDKEIREAQKRNPELIIVVNGTLTQRAFENAFPDLIEEKQNRIFTVFSPCRRNHILTNKIELGKWARAFENAGFIEGKEERKSYLDAIQKDN